MERTQPALADSLARQAAQLRAELASVSPNDKEALALFGRAATLSQWAALAAEDVTHLDEIVAAGFDIISAAGENLELLFPVDPDLLDTMTFVAWSYLERFDYRLDIYDLDEAQRYATDALKLAEGDQIREDLRIRAQTVIACAALRRFELNGDRALLDDAVTRLACSIDLQPDPIAMAALATCLRYRADLSQPEAALDDLNRAGDLLANLIDPETGPPAIPIYPLLRAQWIAELGLVHLTASRLFASSGELDTARELVSAAIETWPSSPEALMAFAEVESTEQNYKRVLKLNKTNARIALQAARRLTDQAVAAGVAEDVVKPAQYVWDLLQQAVDRQVTDANKAHWLPLLTEITGIIVPALAATGSAGAAVKYVEDVRTRVLQENFPDEERELFELGVAGHQDLSAPIRHAFDVRRNTHGSEQSRARARDELFGYIARVRQIPGFSTFLTNPGIDQIRASVDAPLIYLVPGEPAGVALVILPNDEPPSYISLPGCPVAPPPAVERFRTAAFSAQFPPGARRKAIDAISTWAWEAVYELLREVLAGYAYAHIIGASYLALIPWHAARTRSGANWSYAVEGIELRYIPSARALVAAQRRQLPEREARFLVIPQPTGAGNDLDGARSEVNEVANYFASAEVLAQEDINVFGIRRAIGGVGWLHAACHGLADPEDPLASGLLLADGERFTLRDLFKANQGHLLVAVLSACQTNVPDLRLPDEATSLATGLLIGGCRAVIASAWQVPDSATSALMRLIYQRWRREGDEVSSALRKAQLTFATEGISGAEWRSEWADPYFWAGFSYLGP